MKHMKAEWPASSNEEAQTLTATLEDVQPEHETREALASDELYLLVSKDHSMFKIGISSNVADRARTLASQWGARL